MKSIFKKEPSVQPKEEAPAPPPRPEPGTIEVTEYTYGITFLDGEVEMVTAERRDVRWGYEPNDFMVFEGFQYVWERQFRVMDKTHEWRATPDRGSPFNEVFLARLDQIKSIRVVGSRRVEREVT